MIVRIQGMNLRAHIGVHDWEKGASRPLTIDLEVAYDATAAAESDRIVDALDYSRLEAALVEWAEAGRFELLEALAARAVDFLLQSFPAIDHVRLAVTKPGALRHAPAVTVEHAQKRS